MHDPGEGHACSLISLIGEHTMSRSLYLATCLQASQLDDLRESCALCAYTANHFLLSSAAILMLLMEGEPKKYIKNSN